MHPKSPKWLEQIEDAAAFVLQITTGRSHADYDADRLFRSAVERQFEIIGEALLRIARTDPDTAARISDYRKIVGFRNRLVHGYDDIDHQQVWEIVKTFVPVLRQEVEQLLAEAEE